VGRRAAGCGIDQDLRFRQVTNLPEYRQFNHSPGLEQFFLQIVDRIRRANVQLIGFVAPVTEYELEMIPAKRALLGVSTLEAFPRRQAALHRPAEASPQHPRHRSWVYKIQHLPVHGEEIMLLTEEQDSGDGQ
jgi:hypothetical protein